MYILLFYNNGGNIKLVTTYHKPSMIIKTIYMVLKLGEDSLTLERTFVDIIE
jgi:hypothetical protein